MNGSGWIEFLVNYTHTITITTIRNGIFRKWNEMNRRRACVRAYKRTRAIFHWLIGDRARTNKNNELQTGGMYLFTLIAVAVAAAVVYALALRW